MASWSPAVALVLCCVPIAGCERAPQPTAVPPQAAPLHPPDDRAGAGVRLALLAPSANMHLASLEGVLATEGRCLYVVPVERELSRSQPAFQMAGVSWDARTQTLRAAGATFRAGQRVVLGGGYPPNPDALAWRQRPDPSCDASNLFVVGSIESSSAQP